MPDDDAPDFRELPDEVKAIAAKQGGARLLVRARMADKDVFDPAVQAELIAAAADLAPLPKKIERMPCVYFIRCGQHIKIGTTTMTAERRFASMQLPPDAYIVGVMHGHGERTERELHLRFHNFRVSGEWFRSSPELEELITRHAYEARYVR